MSGHSKWANIKHRKGAQDKRRSALWGKLSKLIQVAARENGDLSANYRLRSVVESARAQGLPQDNVERAIRRGTGEDKGATQVEEVVYEAIGPSGTAFVIESLTDNRNRTVADLRHLLGKIGAEIVPAGTAMWQFEHKGQLVFPLPSDLDAFELAVIDAGADDFEKDGERATVYVASEGLKQLQDRLADQGYQAESASLVYLPKNWLNITDITLAKKLLSGMEALDEHDDVNVVYPNFELDDSIMSQIEDIE